MLKIDHVALSVCVYVYPPLVARQRLSKNSPIVARQRLGGNVTAVTNTHATVEELLDASFSMCPVSYQGKCIPPLLLGNGSAKVPLLLLGNGSVETLPR
jgi:hypothetical protein